MDWGNALLRTAHPMTELALLLRRMLWLSVDLIRVVPIPKVIAYAHPPTHPPTHSHTLSHPRVHMCKPSAQIIPETPGTSDSAAVMRNATELAVLTTLAHPNIVQVSARVFWCGVLVVVMKKYDRR